MSKNDKQKREQERLEKKAAEQTGAEAATPMANGPVPPGEGQMTGDASMGSEARIQALQAEVEQLRANLGIVEHVARHGSLPPGASSANPTVETVRVLAGVALERRQQAEEAKAFRADLVALDEVARGGPGKYMPVTTEMGRHLMGSIQELLRVIDMRREQALADATPVSGWSSPRAKELVEKVPPNQRELLLGDLLEDLALLAGETGKNESAQDVLSRRVHEAATLRHELEDLQKKYDVLAQHHQAERAQVLELQAAMVAKRSPDAGAGSQIESIWASVRDAAPDDMLASMPQRIEFIVRAILSEWRGLRELFGKAPMTAVAVRDDSTPALAERYALMVLRWDGAKLDFEMVDGPARPWVDLARPMRHAVDTKLVPSTFR